MTESTFPAFTMPELPMDIQTIREYLPHRYPFLLVDRVTEVTENSIVGYKNVSINEEFLQGHFPTYPIMPGVLIIEALAQVAGVLLLGKEENFGKIAYFMTIDKVKLRKPVFPGDQLVLETDVLKVKAKTGLVAGKAYVNDQLVTEAEFKFAIVDA